MSEPAPPVAAIASPILALRVAIYAVLTADAELATLLDGARIYDAAPRGASGMYVVFGAATARDRSAGSLRRENQELILSVWSRPGGPRPALEVAARIRGYLMTRKWRSQGIGWFCCVLRVKRRRAMRAPASHGCA